MFNFIFEQISFFLDYLEFSLSLTLMYYQLEYSLSLTCALRQVNSFKTIDEGV